MLQNQCEEDFSFHLLFWTCFETSTPLCYIPGKLVSRPTDDGSSAFGCHSSLLLLMCDL